MKLQLQNKATRWKVGRGYDLRQNNPQKFSIIVHSTNGNKGSAFKNEVDFLLNAQNVSSHYIISKNGDIVQFFDDITTYRAWHAGSVRDPIFNNNNSIGIECHFTPGESTYLPEMKQALTDLVVSLRQKHTIIEIETHRNVAIPKGRKIDPSHMSDAEFYAWRSRVLAQNATQATPIIGQPNIGIDILRHKLTQKGVLLYEIDPIICAYTMMGELTRMGNVYPLAQAIHETGFFKSEKWINNRNPAGIGATGGNVQGAVFSSISAGIMSQFAHLLVYATKPEENTFILESIAKLSPRYDAAVSTWGRGIARNWENLDGKWAVPGDNYSNKIKEISKWLMAL